MRRKSKSILAIMLAAAMMSGTLTVPAVAADFSSEETLTVEDQTSGDDLEMQDGDISGASEEEEAVPVEEADEEENQTEVQEETTDTYQENPVAVEIPAEEFSDSLNVGEGEESTYQIWVSDIQVTSSNKDDVLGDLDGAARTVTYNPEQNKLTLNNADITGNIDFTGSAGATLELLNQNTIRKKDTTGYKGSFIWATGSSEALTINGGGTLTIRNGHDSFINCYRNLVIDGVTLDFSMASDCEGFYDGISALYTVDIKNGARVNVQMDQVQGAAVFSGGAMPLSLMEQAEEPERRRGIRVSDSRLELQSTEPAIRTDEGNITVQNSNVVMQGGIRVSGLGNIFIDKTNLDITDGYVGIQCWGKVAISNHSEVKIKTIGSQIEGTEVEITDSRVENIPGVEDGYSIESYGNINIRNSIVIADASFEDNSISAYDIEMQEIKNINITDSWVDSAKGLRCQEKTTENSVLFIGADGLVYGNAVIPGNVQVYPNHTLRVKYPDTLTAPAGLAVTNNGAIEAYCTSIRGTVKNTAPVYTHAELIKWKNNKDSHWQECKRCGAKFEAAAHTYGPWKILKKAGWAWSGEKQHSCTVCSYTQNEKIPLIQVMELKVKGGKKAVNLRWSKVAGADGYMIYGTKCGERFKYLKTVNNKTRKWTQKKLEFGTYYKYYVVAYKMVDGKKTIIGKSSDMHTSTLGKGYGYAKKVTARKTSVVLSVGQSTRIKASLKNTSKKVRDHMLRVRFISTDQDVATVTAKGRVTAKGKGTCYIYCYGLNGLTKKVKITVK